jgi:prevent-host-death family protein
LRVANRLAYGVSTAELSERAEELVRRVHDTGDAVVVLQGGEPAAVLIGATEFAALREHRRFWAAIGEGLVVVDAGRVLTTQELKKSLEAEFGPIAWQPAGPNALAQICEQSSRTSQPTTGVAERWIGRTLEPPDLAAEASLLGRIVPELGHRWPPARQRLAKCQEPPALLELCLWPPGLQFAYGATGILGECKTRAGCHRK